MTKYKELYQDALKQIEDLKKGLPQEDKTGKLVQSLMENADDIAKAGIDITLNVGLYQLSKEHNVHPLYGLVGLQLATSNNLAAGAAGIAMLGFLGLQCLKVEKITDMIRIWIQQFEEVGQRVSPIETLDILVNVWAKPWDQLTCDEKRRVANAMRWNITRTVDVPEHMKGWFDPIPQLVLGVKYKECKGL